MELAESHPFQIRIYDNQKHNIFNESISTHLVRFRPKYVLCFVIKQMFCLYCCILNVFQNETEFFDFNKGLFKVEEKLERKKIFLNLFYLLNYLIYYSVSFSLPILYRNKCNSGHSILAFIIYGTYAGFSRNYFFEIISFSIKNLLKYKVLIEL